LSGLQKSLALFLAVITVCSVAMLVHPARAAAAPASIMLTGWGWCVGYGDIADVSVVLEGSTLPRDNATGIQDLYLTGTLTFNLDDRTDEFTLELRGTRIRSLFFLKQVSGGEIPLIAEFEGAWLSETNYVACEGRIAIPAPNHVAKPYFFILRTRDTDVPTRVTGNWVADVDFLVGEATSAMDNVADRLATGGAVVKQNLADFLTQVAVVIREVRGLGIPYLT
jgi:hypothetical protein